MTNADERDTFFDSVREHLQAALYFALGDAWHGDTASREVLDQLYALFPGGHRPGGAGKFYDQFRKHSIAMAEKRESPAVSQANDPTLGSPGTTDSPPSEQVSQAGHDDPVLADAISGWAGKTFSWVHKPGYWVAEKPGAPMVWNESTPSPISEPRQFDYQASVDPSVAEEHDSYFLFWPSVRDAQPQAKQTQPKELAQPKDSALGE